MFLSCRLGNLLDSDSYTPLIKILTSILEHSLSEFIFNQQNQFAGGSIKIYVSLSVEFVLPVTNWTLQTSPCSSLYVFSILAIGHLFRITSPRTKTLSPTLKFRLVGFHLCLVWSVSSTSFLHRVPPNAEHVATDFHSTCLLSGKYLVGAWLPL